MNCNYCGSDVHPLGPNGWREAAACVGNQASRVATTERVRVRVWTFDLGRSDGGYASAFTRLGTDADRDFEANPFWQLAFEVCGDELRKGGDHE